MQKHIESKAQTILENLKTSSPTQNSTSIGLQWLRSIIDKHNHMNLLSLRMLTYIKSNLYHVGFSYITTFIINHGNIRINLKLF